MKNRLMRNVFTLFLVLGLTSMAPAYAALGNLVALIVCDTAAENIGESVEDDLLNLHTEVGTIARATNLYLKEKIISGSRVKADNIYKALNDLKVGSNDTVIFYYSGHGYRTESKENKWPNLYISADGVGIDFDKVAKIINDKKPRFAFVLCDVCNSFLPEEDAPPMKEFLGTSLTTAERNGYKKLFVTQTGLLQVSSSSVGEYSWCADNGGLYSTTFLKQLKKEVLLGNAASWTDVLGRTYDAIANKQHPQYELTP